GRWALESLLTALLLPLPEAHFLYQEKCECLFLNGTQQVRFLFRWFYDRQEFVRFDSDLGKHVAVTEFGKVDADKWNRNEQWLQYLKAAVNSFCRLAYEMGSYEEPPVSLPLSSRKPLPLFLFFMDPSSPNTILLCTTTGFYPWIEVQWLKNGQLEEEWPLGGERRLDLPAPGDAGDPAPAGGRLHLPGGARQPHPGPSPSPEPHSSSSARSKLWTGIMGAVIGVAFLVVGLFSYLKSKKAIPIQPPAGEFLLFLPHLSPSYKL
uniref:MHC class II beta chain N-terminal domain-containing protein n=1 Tax=Naja naja TaxID=35670 RepID=A0A8C6V5S8_NAJNA